MIKFVRSKSGEEFVTDFRLSDNVYTSAKIKSADKVCLWLGANVMLEYDIAEAETLLSKNFDNATTNTVELQSDMDFIRDQITTMEVSYYYVSNFHASVHIHWNVY